MPFSLLNFDSSSSFTAQNTLPAPQPSRLNNSEEELDFLKLIINSTAPSSTNLSNINSKLDYNNLFANNISQHDIDSRSPQAFSPLGGFVSDDPTSSGALSGYPGSPVDFLDSTYPSPFDSPLEGFAGRSNSSSSSNNINPSALLRNKQRQKTAHLLQTPTQTPLISSLLQPSSPFLATSPAFDAVDSFLGLSSNSPVFSGFNSPTSPLFDSLGSFGTPCSPDFVDLALGGSASTSPLFENLTGDFPLFDAVEPSNSWNAGGNGTTPSVADVLAAAAAVASSNMSQSSPYMNTMNASANSLESPLYQSIKNSPMFQQSAQTPYLGPMASPALGVMASPYVKTLPATPQLQQPSQQEPTVTISISDLQALLKAVQNVPALKQAAIANILATATPVAAPLATPLLPIVGTPTMTMEEDVMFGDMASTNLSENDMDLANSLFGVTSTSAAAAAAAAASTVASEEALVETQPARRRGRKPAAEALNTPKASATTRVTKKTTETASTTSSTKQRRRPSKLYACPHEGCPRTFTRAFNLKTHIETHDPTRDRPFACDDCGRDFVRVHDLQRHRLCHDPERRFVCGSCGKGFTRRDALRRHWGAERLGCQAPEDEGSDEE